MKSIYYRILLGICLLVSLMTTNITSLEITYPETKVEFSSIELYPGGFLQIKVFEAADVRVKGHFSYHAPIEFPFAFNSYIGLVPLSYYTKPGEYPVYIEIYHDMEKKVLTYKINVFERKFVEERIRIPEKTRQEILKPQNQEYDYSKSQEVRNTALSQKSLPIWQGNFTWPLAGRISAEFGTIRYVNDIENGRHSGIDISAPTGTPVSCVNNGKVVFADKLYSTGLTVIVYHGLGVFTTYAHLSQINTQVENIVIKGQIVGLVGSTGLATGPHLHLTFRIGETPVDPYLFLDKNVEWK